MFQKGILILCTYSFLVGDVISWGETCRFKHMPTRMYLAVDSQLQVSYRKQQYFWFHDIHCLAFNHK